MAEQAALLLKKQLKGETHTHTHTYIHTHIHTFCTPARPHQPDKPTIRDERKRVCVRVCVCVCVLGAWEGGDQRNDSTLAIQKPAASDDRHVSSAGGDLGKAQPLIQRRYALCE